MNSSDDPWQACRRLCLNSFIESLDDIAKRDEERQVVHLLGNLTGIVNVSVIKHGKESRLWIEVCYDQRKVDFKTIHHVLLSSGIHPLDTWWSRFKAALYQYMDSNSRDIAKTRPAPCCSNPTEILNKSQSLRRKH